MSATRASAIPPRRERFHMGSVSTSATNFLTAAGRFCGPRAPHGQVSERPGVRTEDEAPAAEPGQELLTSLSRAPAVASCPPADHTIHERFAVLDRSGP